MTDHVPGKPRIGTFVDYYNPRLPQRIGMTEGAGKRGVGPYAALVTNNLGNGLTLRVYMPEWAPIEHTSVPHKADAPKLISQDGTNHPAQDGNGYWEWRETDEEPEAQVPEDALPREALKEKAEGLVPIPEEKQPKPEAKATLEKAIGHGRNTV